MAEAAHAELADAKAEDERRARIDAETRIAVFSNAIHHLNNPLSHLQGAQNAGNSSFEGLTQTVLSLLPENPDDEELMEVRAALETDIDGYRTEARVAGGLYACQLGSACPADDYRGRWCIFCRTFV